MNKEAGDGELERLAPLVGEWSMVPDFAGAPADGGARVVFEWLPGQRFLLQRWEIADLDPTVAPAAGVAIIGVDPAREDGFLQHYFDSRGVARIYRMSFGDGVWELWRDEPDVSPLTFSQRYAGALSDDGRTISGAWEKCVDGRTWERDFGLTYTKLA